jgi:protein involved in polysaccharide export with SLBB domain
MPSIKGEGEAEPCINALQERERSSIVTLHDCSKIAHPQLIGPGYAHFAGSGMVLPLVPSLNCPRVLQPHLPRPAAWTACCLALITVTGGLAQAQAQTPGTPARPAAPSGRSSGSILVDSYILGPGDSVQVELLDVPEYSGMFTIGPDGVLYLPRVRALYVEGLTVEELRYFLQQQFKTYVRRPEVYVRPVSFRPIRVYVGGEVRRPGYYYLSGQQGLNESLDAGATTSVPLPSASGVQLPASISGNAGLASLANSVLSSLRSGSQA